MWLILFVGQTFDTKALRPLSTIHYSKNVSPTSMKTYTVLHQDTCQNLNPSLRRAYGEQWLVSTCSRFYRSTIIFDILGVAWKLYGGTLFKVQTKEEEQLCVSALFLSFIFCFLFVASFLSLLYLEADGLYLPRWQIWKIVLYAKPSLELKVYSSSISTYLVNWKKNGTSIR